MKGLHKGFLGLMFLSTIGLTMAPLAVGTALADNAPATAPAPAKAPAAKPAAKKAVKPVAKKHVKVTKKASHLPAFTGVIRHMDMNASPMTLVAVNNAGKKSEFVFGGDLTSKTAVFKGKKKVGMGGLKEGQKVVIHYHRTHDGIAITAIWIH
jgi:Cu/Ag efflux protein CusF